MGHRVEGAQLDGGRREGRLGRLRRFRRDLHRIPELDVDLFRTMVYVEGVLSGLSCELSRPAPGCVCAFFDCGSPAATAIRADMDALPITEATGSAFSSRHAGRMHACGHDAHMAMALAAAVEVDELLSAGAKLGRSVLFVFQPAEETTGGAATVCASGVFERYRVDRIFGFHVWPDLPWGAVASCAGPLLARSSETHVHIEGVSTHIAKTYGVAAPESRDAMLAAARFVTGVRELMDRLGAEEPCLAPAARTSPAACACSPTQCSTVRARGFARCLTRRALRAGARGQSSSPTATLRWTTIRSCSPSPSARCPSSSACASRF